MVTPQKRLILLALAKFEFMKAEQVLHAIDYQDGSLTYVKALLKEMAEEGYVDRFHEATPHPGNKPYIYILGKKGVRYLREHESMKLYYSAEQKEKDSPYYIHCLGINEVMLAAIQLERDYPQFHLSRILKDSRIKLLTNRVVADCWMEFHVDTGAKKVRRCFWVEYDTGSQSKSQIAEKIKRIFHFIDDGGYEELYGVKAVTILFATLGGEQRVQNLLTWIEETMSGLYEVSETELFRVAAISPANSLTSDFFLKPMWTIPSCVGERKDVSLLW